MKTKSQSRARTLEPDKIHKIRTPIPIRVQQYQNYPIPTSNRPSNHHFTFLKVFTKIPIFSHSIHKLNDKNNYGIMKYNHFRVKNIYPNPTREEPLKNRSNLRSLAQKMINGTKPSIWELISAAQASPHRDRGNTNAIAKKKQLLHKKCTTRSRKNACDREEEITLPPQKHCAYANQGMQMWFTATSAYAIANHSLRKRLRKKGVTHKRAYAIAAGPSRSRIRT